MTSTTAAKQLLGFSKPGFFGSLLLSDGDSSSILPKINTPKLNLLHQC